MIATENQKTYKIPAVNFPALQEKVDFLNTRAEKLGLEPIRVTVVRTFTEITENWLGFEFNNDYLECTVEGSAPKLNGWCLVAVVEPLDGDEMMVKEVPGQHCPVEYRTTNLHCDHCNSIRRRNAIFVLRHDSGEHKQVGRNCLADFLGHISPETLLNAAELLFNGETLIGSAGDREWSEGRVKPYVPINEFLGVVSIIVRQLGWVSRTQAREQDKQATADLAMNLCLRPNDRFNRSLIEQHKLYPQDDDIELARKAREWAAAIDPKVGDSFLYNLGACCRRNIVEYENAGFVGAAIKAYKRHIQEELQKQRPVGTAYLGVVDERSTFENLTIEVSDEQESTFGLRTFIRFTDPNGNILVWWGSGRQPWAKLGSKVTVKATVKKHEEYRGVPQTVLTRVKPV